MNKNDIFSILRGFSKAEIEQLKKFLRSPYFGEKKKISRLYNEIINYYPFFTHVNLDKRRLSQKLFPGKKYNDSTFRNLFCDLNEAILHFLEIENFERSTLYRQNFLFNELSIKGMHDEFAKAVNKLEYYSDDLADWSYFLNHHFIETYKFNFSHHNIKLSRENILNREISYLNNSVNYLVYFFVTELVALYLNYLFYKKSFNSEKIQNNIDAVFGLINFANYKNAVPDDKYSFIFDLYSALIKAFSGFDKEENYYYYKKILDENIAKISSDEIRFHYYQLVSYCTLKNLDRNEDFENELFLLYNEMIDKSYYIDRNTRHLPHELYRNILFLGLRMKKFDWVYGFIQKYSWLVHPNDRLNMLNYGNAYLNFHLGNYEKSLENISEIGQNFFVFKIDLKNLTLMIYYQLGYGEETISYARSYREFLRKNKLVNPERQKRYINFSKYLEKIILYKESSRKKDIGYLRFRIQQINEIAFKSWLLEKISIMQSGFRETG